ncbi:acyltransferase family protein [Pseudomonas sp. 2835]|uniref:acyltransferase family protein n=1 Tax=Pseudomonas sp. 2835 TaxID=3156451 RepID=UPI003D1F3994
MAFGSDFKWGRVMSKGIPYSPQIDGLRAIAVLLVVFAHVGVSFLQGGYIGVDVFFVISGYLITSILLKEQASESFSFFEFYKRRARRILPALLLVIVSTLLVGYFILLPSDYSFLSLSAISAVLFSANIFFLERVARLLCRVGGSAAIAAYLVAVGGRAVLFSLASDTDCGTEVL